jgi:hypothetical protein
LRLKLTEGGSASFHAAGSNALHEWVENILKEEEGALVTAVLVEEDVPVKKGQPLFQFDRRPYENKVRGSLSRPALGPRPWISTNRLMVMLPMARRKRLWLAPQQRSAFLSRFAFVRANVLASKYMVLASTPRSDGLFSTAHFRMESDLQRRLGAVKSVRPRGSKSAKLTSAIYVHASAIYVRAKVTPGGKQSHEPLANYWLAAA